VSTVQLRRVECHEGPQDGATIHVASAVKLPETISFPAGGAGVHRHVYKMCAQGEGFTEYCYDHLEVGA